MTDADHPLDRPGVDPSLGLAYVEGELAAAEELRLLASLSTQDRAWLEALRGDRARMRAEVVPAAPFDLAESVLAAVERQELLGDPAQSAPMPAWKLPVASPVVRRSRWQQPSVRIAAALGFATVVGSLWLLMSGPKSPPMGADERLLAKHSPDDERSAADSTGGVVRQATAGAPAHLPQSLVLVPPLPALPPAPSSAAQPEREGMLDFVLVMDVPARADAERLFERGVAGLRGAAVVRNFAPEELRDIERSAEPALAAFTLGPGSEEAMQADIPLARPIVGTDEDAAYVETRMLLASEGATHTLSIDRRDLSEALGGFARMPGVHLEGRGGEARTWTVPEHARIDVPVVVRVRPRG